VPKTYFNFDAAPSAFLERELQAVRAKVYEVQYGPLKARTLIPVVNEDDPGADSIKLEVLDSVGLAKVVSNYATDFPEADVKRDEIIVPIKSLGSSYRYSIQEARGAAFSRKPLPQWKANSARKSVEQRIDIIGATGDAGSGLLGLLNQPNALLYVVPAGATTGTTWGNGTGVGAGNKSPDEILKDLFGIVEKIVTTTKENEQPDTLALPIAQRALISRLARSGTSDTTVLQFFLANQDAIKRVVAWDRCKGAGAGAVDRMVAFEASADKVQLVIPQEFEQFPAQEDGMTLKTPCHARTAGVLSPYPLSICYGDGI
jgi:hypothetical protein